MKYKKGSFTVIPNKDFLCGKPSQMQSIYFWICEHADNQGICFPSRRTIAKEAGVDIKTVDKYLVQLEEKGFLKKENRCVKGKKEKTSNIYQIMIIEEVDPKTVQPTYTENGATCTTENGAETISIINNTNIGEVSPFVWEDYLEKMVDKSSQRHIRIIGAYFKIRGKRFDSLSEVQSAIGRHVKPAKALEGFPNSKIGASIRKLNYEFPAFTLETVLKDLTK